MLRLKELRDQKRLNQQGLAIKLNVAQGTISAYEVGTRTPDIQMLIRFADFFDVSVDYLVGRSDVKKQIQSSDLSQDELDHIYAYRQLSKEKKGKVSAYMEGLKDQ